MKNTSVTIWSAVELPAFMEGLLQRLRHDGFAARQRFAVRAESYRAAQGPIRRGLLRWRMYCEFPLRVGLACLFSRRSDVHIVTTNPFFAPWVAVRSAVRRPVVIHLVYDLFPDALIVARRLRHDARSAASIRWLVRDVFDRATANVFLGDTLQRYAERTFGSISHTRVIPVGADAVPFERLAPSMPPSGTSIDVLYCGNLGAMHDVDTLIAAAESATKRGRAPGVTITFHASGTSYQALKARAASMRAGVPAWLHFEGPLADPRWVKRMARAHVALVTMKPGSERVVMPSKTYSALAAGQAVLAVCAARSDLAEVIVRYECGWVVAPGDSDGLVQALDEIAARPDILQRKRENAFRAGQEVFSEAAIGALWRELITTLMEQGSLC